MIEFRKLTHEDYEDIVDISKSVWDGGDYLPEVFHTWVDSEGVFIGAIDSKKNKVIGVGKLSFLPDGSGWLEGLRVHIDYRGQKLARAISEELLKIAENYLNQNKIKKIAFGTHATNKESIHLMQNYDFTLYQSYIIAAKEISPSALPMSLDEFTVTPWNIDYEPFCNLPYFQRRRQVLPLAFVFQEVTKELFLKLKEENALVCINGFPGILKFKEQPNFIVIEESFEAIHTFTNYCIAKYQASPMTSIMEEDIKLMKQLQEAEYEAWFDWKPDYLYFVKA